LSRFAGRLCGGGSSQLYSGIGSPGARRLVHLPRPTRSSKAMTISAWSMVGTASEAEETERTRRSRAPGPPGAPWRQNDRDLPGFFGPVVPGKMAHIGDQREADEARSPTTRAVGPAVQPAIQAGRFCVWRWPGARKEPRALPGSSLWWGRPRSRPLLSPLR